MRADDGSTDVFLLNPAAVAGSGQAIADIARHMLDDCALELQTSSGAAVGTIFFQGFFGGPCPRGQADGVGGFSARVSLTRRRSREPGARMQAELKASFCRSCPYFLPK